MYKVVSDTIDMVRVKYIYIRAGSLCHFGSDDTLRDLLNEAEKVVAALRISKLFKVNKSFDLLDWSLRDVRLVFRATSRGGFVLWRSAFRRL